MDIPVVAIGVERRAVGGKPDRIFFFVRHSDPVRSVRTLENIGSSLIRLEKAIEAGWNMVRSRIE